MAYAGDFATIRAWDGSQARAWEELCYQLRPPAPAGTTTTKTGDPDAGLEWYVAFPDGRQWGWQAKYTDDVDGLIGQMRSSLRTVLEKRPEVDRLTFCIPIDLAEGRDRQGARRRTRSARVRLEESLARWRSDIRGADRVDIRIDGGGDILDRLARPEHAGRRWFWWQERALDLDWLRRRLDESIETAGERYSPELDVELGIGRELDGLAANESFWARFRALREAVAHRLAHVQRSLGDEAGGADLRAAIERFTATLPHPPVALPTDRRELERWQGAVQGLESQAWAYGYSHRSDDDTEPQRWARSRAGRLAAVVDDLAAFLEAPEFRAASDRAYLLLGEAGSGKTFRSDRP
jgi:hypothetical protein